MPKRLNKKVICADGFTMSVQANETAYCSPQIDNATVYYAVELGFPSAYESLIIKYAESPGNPTGTVYGFVPSNLVVKVVKKHGGIEDGEIPPLDITPRND